MQQTHLFLFYSLFYRIMNRSRSITHENSFIVEKHILFWDEGYPLTYKLNDYDTKKSFTLVIYQQKEDRKDFVFYCRLYYINAKRRKQIGIDSSVKYELADVWLNDKYQGASYQRIKYSKQRFELIDRFLEYLGIINLILWTWKDNVKAIKRYQDIGFMPVDNGKIVKYYSKVAKRNAVSEEDLRVFLRQE